MRSDNLVSIRFFLFIIGRNLSKKPYILCKWDNPFNVCQHYTKLMFAKSITYYYVTNKGKFVKMHDADYIESLNDLGKSFSGRAFIWSRTLPLLMDNIFLGTGPDTFLLAFPNDDFVALSNSGYGDELITKPHNMYLQTAVQTGVLSLICFLVFYIWYFLE